MLENARKYEKDKQFREKRTETIADIFTFRQNQNRLADDDTSLVSKRFYRGGVF